MGSALERIEKLLAGREVETDIPEDLPMVPLDGVLMEQVFINLLENAARHTPAGTAIALSARLGKDALLVEVADRGPGLAETSWSRSSRSSTMPNRPRPAPAWAWPSAGPSSTPTADASGRRTAPAAAPCSASPCR